MRYKIYVSEFQSTRVLPGFNKNLAIFSNNDLYKGSGFFGRMREQLRSKGSKIMQRSRKIHPILAIYQITNREPDDLKCYELCCIYQDFIVIISC